MPADLIIYSVSALLSVGCFYVIILIYHQLKHKQKGNKPMREFVPVEPTIQAAEIISLSVSTTAVLDDGSSVTVPNDATDGAYVIAQADGSLKLAGKADFEARYKAA